MADSKTKRLCVLLTVSNSRHCIAYVYLIQQLLVSQTNKRHPQIVAAQKWAGETVVAASDQKKYGIHI